MICILNCCKVIFGLIRHTSGNEAGADAFIPILIFVVLRASPDNMLSNLEYINRFRNPEKLMGEGGYYLSSLVSEVGARRGHIDLPNRRASETSISAERPFAAM